MTKVTLRQLLFAALIFAQLDFLNLAPIRKKYHSTPNGAKFLRLGHDLSQNLIKTGQVVTKYKI